VCPGVSSGLDKGDALQANWIEQHGAQIEALDKDGVVVDLVLPHPLDASKEVLVLGVHIRIRVHVGGDAVGAMAVAGGSLGGNSFDWIMEQHSPTRKLNWVPIETCIGDTPQSVADRHNMFVSALTEANLPANFSKNLAFALLPAGRDATFTLSTWINSGGIDIRDKVICTS
jgi:hypothetical protein